jgi:hypothetical protein
MHLWLNKSRGSVFRFSVGQAPLCRRRSKNENENENEDEDEDEKRVTGDCWSGSRSSLIPDLDGRAISDPFHVSTEKEQLHERT